MLILLINVHHKRLLKPHSIPASSQGVTVMAMVMFIVDGAATGLQTGLAPCCVISFPGYSMTLRKWEKEREPKHLGSVNECGSSLTHTHANNAQKQCPRAQLPCFVPPPNFTGLCARKKCTRVHRLKK